MGELRDTVYLAFDPGKATGWAAFDVNGEVLGLGTCVSHDELIEFIGEFPGKPKVVIYENFRLMKRKAMQQSGSQMPASVAIGAILTGAAMWRAAQVVKQESSIKPMAEMMSGVVPKGAHSKSHQVDAFNHGVYYLVKHKVRKSIGEQKLERAAAGDSEAKAAEGR